ATPSETSAKHPTTNIQHRTSNQTTRISLDVGCSMLVVGCFFPASTALLQRSPTRLRPFSSPGVFGRNAVGVVSILGQPTQGRRSARQPWAGGRNPVGIG